MTVRFTSSTLDLECKYNDSFDVGSDLVVGWNPDPSYKVNITKEVVFSSITLTRLVSIRFRVSHSLFLSAMSIPLYIYQEPKFLRTVRLHIRRMSRRFPHPLLPLNPLLTPPMFPLLIPLDQTVTLRMSVMMDIWTGVMEVTCIGPVATYARVDPTPLPIVPACVS